MGTPTILLQTAVDRAVLQTAPYPLLHHTQARRPASLAQTWSASVIRDALWHVRQSYVTEWESTDVWNTCVTLNWQQRARQGVLRFTSLLWLIQSNSANTFPATVPLSLISKVRAILHCWSRGIFTAELKTQPFWLLLPGRKASDCLTLSPTACTSPQRYKALFKKQSVLQKIYSFRDTTKWNSRQM